MADFAKFDKIQGVTYQGLPIQKLPRSKKNKDWAKACINYYTNYRYSDGTNLRSSRFNKKVNYDLYNGKVHYNDVERICDPLGVETKMWADKFQHYDVISEPIRLLIGEEAKRPDNSIVICESSEDLTRKQEAAKANAIRMIEEEIARELEAQGQQMDPNNLPEPLQKLKKYDAYTTPDIIESKANKLLKREKRRLNTKEMFSRGWKDALIAGEEIYWVGILNNEVVARRVNPINVSIILDDDTQHIDDALAVVEERMLAIPSILDEYGDDLTNDDLENLQILSKGTFGTFNSAGGFEPQFTIEQNNVTVAGITPTSNYNYHNRNNESVRVVRVEWMSMKKVGTLKWTDENGSVNEELVDEELKFNLFKEAYPDAEIEWFWINEPWEGVKIGHDIYIGMRPKPNQRRRMDNPYYSKLGYVGYIYEATNSKSISLVERLKAYQYLYDFIHYRFEKRIANDKGKVFLMDMAQLPESYGIDIERWLYYLNDMGIGLINSFEEGKKGFATGQLAKFNQFATIDLSLAQSINQYVQILDYIKQQIYFVSGVSPQRMAQVSSSELVGNVERSINQSSIITEYLFMAHDEVKSRVYTAIIEAAKMTYRNGMTTQYVLDDFNIEMLNILPLEFENSEFNVFVSNTNKDFTFKQKLEGLLDVALKSQQVSIAAIAESLLDDSPKDIINKLRTSEQEMQAQKAQQSQIDQQMQKQALQAKQQETQAKMDLENRRLELDQYIADSNNQTKIQVAEISVYSRQQDLDLDKSGIPDPIELANLSLKERQEQSKMFTEQQKINSNMNLKQREIQAKKEIEDKKIEAIKIQNASQEKIAKEQIELKKKEMANKLKIEQLKAKNKNKPKD